MVTLEKYYPIKVSNYRIKKWESKLHKNHIKVVLIAIRRPQGNLAERVNRELGRLFRTYCNTNQSKWAEYLEFFEQAINGNYNDTCLLYTSRCV